MKLDAGTRAEGRPRSRRRQEAQPEFEPRYLGCYQQSARIFPSIRSYYSPPTVMGVPSGNRATSHGEDVRLAISAHRNSPSRAPFARAKNNVRIEFGFSRSAAA